MGPVGAEGAAGRGPELGGTQGSSGHTPHFVIGSQAPERAGRPPGIPREVAAEPGLAPARLPPVSALSQPLPRAESTQTSALARPTLQGQRHAGGQRAKPSRQQGQLPGAQEPREGEREGEHGGGSVHSLTQSVCWHLLRPERHGSAGTSQVSVPEPMASSPGRAALLHVGGSPCAQPRGRPHWPGQGPQADGATGAAASSAPTGCTACLSASWPGSRQPGAACAAAAAAAGTSQGRGCAVSRVFNNESPVPPEPPPVIRLT